MQNGTEAETLVIKGGVGGGSSWLENLSNNPSIKLLKYS